MKKPIIVLGIGELGSVFARAFLKNNHPVYPITRATDINELRSLIGALCSFKISLDTLRISLR
jgi:prephenate dehydrogenase